MAFRKTCIDDMDYLGVEGGVAFRGDKQALWEVFEVF